MNPMRMSLLSMKRIALVALFAIVAVRFANGNTIYSYTGNDYTNCTGLYCLGGPYAANITFDTTLTGAALDNLTFTSNVVNTVDSFSFTDGSGLAINQNTPGVTLALEISTDSSGNIIDWQLGALAEIAGVPTQIDSGWHSPAQPNSGQDLSLIAMPSEQIYGYVNDDPGTWKMTAAAPEPRFGFIGAGLLMMIVIAMWRKRPA